jgi:2-iminoacetate synthase
MDSVSYLENAPIDAEFNALSATTAANVEKTLAKRSLSLSDFPVLISKAALPYIEEIARRSHALTVQRFGHTMQLFIPMYLSNVCYNKCTYCGFSIEHKYKRITLSKEEILKEGFILKEKGFQHLLLLTGEAPGTVDASYIAQAAQLLSPLFPSIGIEVQPLNYEDYCSMRDAGVDSLTLYQETYHKGAYANYHKAGKKKNYTNRLQRAEDGAKAGFYKMNIGALLGLYHWEYDALATAHHLDYLQKHYWKTKYAVSFPRIQKMVGEFQTPYDVPHSAIAQFICAFRLCFPDVGITMSTREPAHLRDHFMKLGITQMSAESHTEPGGYSGSNAEKQFEISDARSLAEIKSVLEKNGYEAVMKDWDTMVENHA